MPSFGAERVGRPPPLGLLLAGIASLIPSLAYSQTPEEVVDRHIEAVGGRAALERLEDSIGVWSFTFEMGSTTADGTITIRRKRPDRYQIDVDAKLAGQDFRQVRSFDGKDGWTVLQGNRSTIQGEELIHLRNEALRANGSDLFRAKESGSTLGLKGEESVDGRPVFVLEVTPKKGSKITYYVDKETHLISKSVRSFIQQGYEVDVESWPTAHRTVEGVRVPHEMDIVRTIPELNQEQLYKMRLEEVKFNVGLDDTVFRSLALARPGKPPDKKKGAWY